MFSNVGLEKKQAGKDRIPICGKQLVQRLDLCVYTILRAGATVVVEC